MLKPEELRIGNYILDDEHLVGKVEKIESDYYNEWDGMGDEPIQFTIQPNKHNNVYGSKVFGIPLTEEWLLKFGFLKDHKKCNLAILDTITFWNKGIGLSPIIDGKRYRYTFGSDPLQGINIDYVHHLQNFMYIITGEELILKEA